jgi:hypothetical protein
MYVDISHIRQNGKTYSRYLLRESFREYGKVKHRTIANLSGCSAAEIEAVRLALRHKDNLSVLSATAASGPGITLGQGACYGAVHVVYEVARELGLEGALGTDRKGRLALWQVIARVIDQGSRLSAVRLARHHAVAEVLDLGGFDEDDLYANLDWLAEKQAIIEQRLCADQNLAGGLYLYDVTSSYLEGTKNAFAAFGYNRDQKKGKRQLVVGLLCNGKGRPLAIEVFPGNTQDTKTFAAQITKVAERFGGGTITLVGDRGMIKGPQIKDLARAGFHFITAITKPQIEALLAKNLLQMDLFDVSLAEVTDHEQRYILRRNPDRAEELAAARDDKYAVLEKAVTTANAYLAAHPRAQANTQLARLKRQATRLRIDGWTSLALRQRTIVLTKNAEALAESSKLDGCYALKTDLPHTQASKDMVHDRYKDLALVEWAFRSCKTVHLEMRPIYVRLESRTRGHAFVVMLAYSIIQALAARWRHLDTTVEAGLDQLATLCLTEIHLPDQSHAYRLPKPRPAVQQLLDAANVRLPAKVTSQKSIVSTKTKLTSRRK